MPQRILGHLQPGQADGKKPGTQQAAMELEGPSRPGQGSAGLPGDGHPRVEQHPGDHEGGGKVSRRSGEALHQGRRGNTARVGIGTEIQQRRHHLGTPLPAGNGERIGLPFPVDVSPQLHQFAKACGGTDHDRLVECAGWLFVTPVEVGAPGLHQPPENLQRGFGKHVGLGPGAPQGCVDVAYPENPLQLLCAPGAAQPNPVVGQQRGPVPQRRPRFGCVPEDAQVRRDVLRDLVRDLLAATMVVPVPEHHLDPGRPAASSFHPRMHRPGDLELRHRHGHHPGRQLPQPGLPGLVGIQPGLDVPVGTQPHIPGNTGCSAGFVPEPGEVVTTAIGVPGLHAPQHPDALRTPERRTRIGDVVIPGGHRGGEDRVAGGGRRHPAGRIEPVCDGHA